MKVLWMQIRAAAQKLHLHWQQYDELGERLLNWLFDRQEVHWIRFLSAAKNSILQHLLVEISLFAQDIPS